MSSAYENLALPYVSFNVYSKKARESVSSFRSIGAEILNSSRRKGSGGNSSYSISLLSSRTALYRAPALDYSMQASSSMASSLAACFWLSSVSGTEGTSSMLSSSSSSSSSSSAQSGAPASINLFMSLM